MAARCAAMGARRCHAVGGEQEQRRPPPPQQQHYARASVGTAARVTVAAGVAPAGAVSEYRCACAPPSEELAAPLHLHCV